MGSRDEKYAEGEWLWVRSPSSSGSYLSTEYRAKILKVSDKGTLTIAPMRGERTETIMRASYRRVRRLSASDLGQLEDDQRWAALKLVTADRHYRSETPNGKLRIREPLHAKQLPQLRAELEIATVLMENARQRRDWDEE